MSGLTALDPRENDFDNMYKIVKELKEGKTVPLLNPKPGNKPSLTAVVRTLTLSPNPPPPDYLLSPPPVSQTQPPDLS